MGYNIAIDGPAGAGKSTIAKLVAKELGFILSLIHIYARKQQLSLNSVMHSEFRYSHLQM